MGLRDSDSSWQLPAEHAELKSSLPKTHTVMPSWWPYSPARSACGHPTHVPPHLGLLSYMQFEAGRRSGR